MRALGSRHSFNDIADADGAGRARPRSPPTSELDRGAATVSFGGGRHLRRARPRPGRRRHGAAQPGLAPAHLRRRRGRDRDARIGGRERQPRDGGRRPGDGHLERRASSARRAATPTSTGWWSASARSASSPASRSTSSPPTTCASASSRTSRGTRWSSTSTRSPAAGYSVSVLTRWGDDGRSGVGQEPRDRRARDRAADLFGARPATVDRHPILGIDPVNCTPQLGRPGSWSDRLPHFRMGFTPSSGEELQSEYLVPREHAVAAIEAVRALADRIRPLLQVCEIRTVAADRLWMSPQYRCDTRRPPLHLDARAGRPSREVLADARAGARAVRRAPALGQAVPRRRRARSPRATSACPTSPASSRRYDPRGAFRNEWLDRVLGAALTRHREHRGQLNPSPSATTRCRRGVMTSTGTPRASTRVGRSRRSQLRHRPRPRRDDDLVVVVPRNGDTDVTRERGHRAASRALEQRERQLQRPVSLARLGDQQRERRRTLVRVALHRIHEVGRRGRAVRNDQDAAA